MGISARGGRPLAPPKHTSRKHHTSIESHHTQTTSHSTAHVAQGVAPPGPATPRSSRGRSLPQRKPKKKAKGNGGPVKRTKILPVMERVKKPLGELRDDTGPFSSLDLPTKPSLLDIDYDKDKLGTLVHSLSAKLAASSSWDSFAKQVRGRPHLSEEIHRLNHPAASLLAQFRDHGVPVVLNEPDW